MEQAIGLLLSQVDVRLGLFFLFAFGFALRPCILLKIFINFAVWHIGELSFNGWQCSCLFSPAKCLAHLLLLDIDFFVAPASAHLPLGLLLLLEINLSLNGCFFFGGKQAQIALFVYACRRQQLGVQAKLLDVAEDEEGVLYLALLHDLLQILILDQKRVDELLRFRERQPDDQICFQRQLIQL